MKSNKQEKLRFAIILLLFSSFAVLLAIADRAPLHLEKNCECIHFSRDISDYVRGVTQQTSQGPYVYRIFIPYLVLGAHSTLSLLSLVNIDFLLKIFFLILCQLSLYYYLRNYFSVIVTLVGISILDVLLSFTFSSMLGPSVLESSDILNLLVFTLALHALHKNSFNQFLILLFIGTFNRETTWLLVPILLLNDLSLKKGVHRSLIAIFAVAIPYFGLRIIISPTVPDWFTFEGIIRNIPFLSPETTSNAVIANAHTAFLLGPLIILSLINFNKHPQFLRTTFYITPLFIVIHYLFGSIIETRLWLPLLVILLPLSLDTLVLMFNEELPQSLNDRKELS